MDADYVEAINCSGSSGEIIMKCGFFNIFFVVFISYASLIFFLSCSCLFALFSTTQDGSDTVNETIVLKAVNTIVSFHRFLFFCFFILFSFS
jgi:hypothetical protein